MKTKTNILKLIKTETTIFNPASTYEFKMVGNIKIETVESYLKRGGEITYLGTFSLQEHPTNTPFIDDTKKEAA